MVPFTSLLIPIILSAVLVFIASSVIHMAMTYHRNDLRAVPNETAVMDAMRPFNLAPGDYAVPMAGSPAAMKDPAFMERMARGPVLLMTVVPSGPVNMGQRLIRWFIYILVVSVFAGYVASRALESGAVYLDVFRFAGTTAFCGYALALAQNSIWWNRNWAMTLRSMFDGLIYALLTAGAFGWLWPR